jgi:hypothetical protein
MSAIDHKVHENAATFLQNELRSIVNVSHCVSSLISPETLSTLRVVVLFLLHRFRENSIHAHNSFSGTIKSLPHHNTVNKPAISIMKFVSIIFVASVASTFAAERGLQTLAKKWNITDPVFTYDQLAFDLDYQVSDFIDDTMTTYELYTSPGCKETNVVVASTYLTSTKPDLTGVAYDPLSTGDGVRDQKLTVGVVAAEVVNSPIYAEEIDVDGAVTAEIDFCVRFSLQATGGGATPVEVNFLETLVKLFVDLSDGFVIGDVAVEPKIRVTNTANQVYLLDGYQCNDANDALTEAELAATRNQGSVIRVCVKPDAEATADGIKMRSIDEFTFTRDTISQPAITSANTQSDNGLTSLSCTSGADVCSFETILFAAFYTTAGTVAGSGTGSMQFGARRLRALQATLPEAAATSELELDFGINAPGADSTNLRDGSGAATSGVMAGAALVMAGAFALI